MNDDDDFRAGSPLPPEYGEAVFRRIAVVFLAALLFAGCTCMWIHW